MLQKLKGKVIGLFVAAALTTASSQAIAQQQIFHAVVAQDGTGQYSTVQCSSGQLGISVADIRKKRIVQRTGHRTQKQTIHSPYRSRQRENNHSSQIECRGKTFRK